MNTVFFFKFVSFFIYFFLAYFLEYISFTATLNFELK